MHAKSKYYVLLFIFAFTCICPHTVHAVSSDFPESVPTDTDSGTEDIPDIETSNFPDTAEDGTENTPDFVSDNFITGQEAEETEKTDDSVQPTETDGEAETAKNSGEETGKKEDRIPDGSEKHDIGLEDFENFSEPDLKTDVTEETTIGEPDSSFETDSPSDDSDMLSGDDTFFPDGDPVEEAPSVEDTDLSGLFSEEEETANDYFFEKDFTEYTVTEGLLLLIFCTLFCKLCIDLTAKMNHWRIF